MSVLLKRFSWTPKDLESIKFEGGGSVDDKKLDGKSDLKNTDADEPARTIYDQIPDNTTPRYNPLSDSVSP